MQGVMVDFVCIYLNACRVNSLVGMSRMVSLETRIVLMDDGCEKASAPCHIVQPFSRESQGCVVTVYHMHAFFESIHTHTQYLKIGLVNHFPGAIPQSCRSTHPVGSIAVQCLIVMIMELVPLDMAEDMSPHCPHSIVSMLQSFQNNTPFQFY